MSEKDGKQKSKKAAPAAVANKADAARKSSRSALPDAFAGFDIENPKLPAAIEEQALASGGFPYDKRMKDDAYLAELVPLQIELLKLQKSLAVHKQRLVVVVEGRDAAGKGGLIAALAQHLNPRHAHVVALSKPMESELGQWYFQRYIAQLPTAGDLVIFDRSWYNRAGVERVMGFCDQDQLADFLREAPVFEGMLVRDGITLIKLYLSIGRATQLKRLHNRHHDPLKQWKLSPIDIDGLDKWDEYSQAQEEMFRFTHTDVTPWTVVRANDKYRARLEGIRHILSAVSYDAKDKKAVGKPDPLIVGAGPEFFEVQ
jgi:polyphosphate kinase